MLWRLATDFLGLKGWFSRFSSSFSKPRASSWFYDGEGEFLFKSIVRGLFEASGMNYSVFLSLSLLIISTLDFFLSTTSLLGSKYLFDPIFSLNILKTTLSKLNLDEP